MSATFAARYAATSPATRAWSDAWIDPAEYATMADRYAATSLADRLFLHFDSNPGYSTETMRLVNERGRRYLFGTATGFDAKFAEYALGRMYDSQSWRFDGRTGAELIEAMIELEARHADFARAGRWCQARAAGVAALLVGYAMRNR